MAHKALIGGTVYEKSGGADLVGGTVYKKEHGKVLAGGTVYEVGFAKPVTIVVNADNAYADCWVEHNGVRYKYPSTTFVANVGDTILCHCYGEGMDESGEAVITVNGHGNVVARAPYMGTEGHADEMEAEYEYTVVSDAAIHLEHNENTGYMYGYIEDNVHITEISDGQISFTIKEGNTVVNHQAAFGMTWGEWVDSEYNPSADYIGTVKVYSVNRDMIQNDNANLYVYVPTDYSFPSPSDLIIANFAYQLAKD